MGTAAKDAVAAAALAGDPGGALIADLYAAILQLMTPATAIPCLEGVRDRAAAAGEPGVARVARAYLVVALALDGKSHGLDGEASVLIEAGAERNYDRYISIWAGFLVALVARDGARLRELIDIQLSDLAASGLQENWLTMFSDALAKIGERADYLPQLQRARQRAESEGRRADADTVLALAYAAAVDDEWDRAAELLGAVRKAMFHDTAGFIHHTLIREQVVRPRLDPDAFATAEARGEGRDLAAVLAEFGV
jgi:hypothetical protein